MSAHDEMNSRGTDWTSGRMVSWRLQTMNDFWILPRTVADDYSHYFDSMTSVNQIFVQVLYSHSHRLLFVYSCRLYSGSHCPVVNHVHRWLNCLMFMFLWAATVHFASAKKRNFPVTSENKDVRTRGCLSQIYVRNAKFNTKKNSMLKLRLLILYLLSLSIKQRNVHF